MALILIVLIPTGMLSWRGHFGWITLLNLPLLGLPLFYGAGAISLDHAIAAAFRRRFPRFEALSAAAVASLPHVVILGGGFGGLAAARGLRHAPCRVTLLDQRNYHLFQPLLYQVATAWLSPAEIATPLREMFRTQANVRVLLGEVTGVDPAVRMIALGETRLAYDFLIIATGARHSYFGHDDWGPAAPGLKGIEDALDIRRRLLFAFEAAESSQDEAERRAWLTFIIIGGGPTGVELAGAVAELAQHGLTGEFRAFDPATARIVLVQAADRVLPTFPPSLSNAAERSLAALGVEVLTSRKVKTVDASGADVAGEWIAARTVMWAAGVAASPSADWLGAEADPAAYGWDRTCGCPAGPKFSSSAIRPCAMLGVAGRPPALRRLRSRVAPTQPERSGLLSPAVPRRRRFATAITAALPRLGGRQRSRNSAGSG